MFPPETQQVRSDCSLEERASKIKGMIAKNRDTIQTGLFQAKLIGEELWQAKDQCISEGKEWWKWLGDHEIEPRWAQKRMKIAEYWTDLVAHSQFVDCTGVEESLILIGETAPMTAETNGKKEKPICLKSPGTLAIEKAQKLLDQLTKAFDNCMKYLGSEGHGDIQDSIDSTREVWKRWSATYEGE